MAVREEPSRRAASRRARGSLSPEEILHAAQLMVERDGLDHLSVNRLAESIGAGATSIYSYFPSKDDLVAALTENVTKEMYLHLAPMGDGPWDVELVDYFVAFRRLLHRTPVYREVFAYRVQSVYKSRMGTGILRHYEQILGLFVRSGLTVDEAVSAFGTFSAHIISFVLVEQGWRDGKLEDDNAELLKLALAKVPDDLPALGLIEDFGQAETPDDELYRLGLELLIDGLCDQHPKLVRPRTRR